jgi:AAA domain
VPNPLEDPLLENAKVIILGDQGHGKTGLKAALVAQGYKLRGIDTDKGSKILRSLLTNPNYPYAAYMKKHSITPDISIIPIDVPMDAKSTTIKGVSWDILGPTSSAGWNRVVRLVTQEWIDGDRNLGPITDWDQDTILDFDTVSTLAEIAKYWVQDMNGRLGSLNDEHGRDTGGAQEMITRMMTRLTSTQVKCNVIVNAHITWIDQTNHATQSPDQRLRAQLPVDARGFPAIIGRALSPVFGKKWNDVFIVRRTGSNANAERKIYTVPTDNTDAKNSVWLEPSYPISTGLAEIFSALRYQDPPTEFIKAIRGQNGEPKNGESKGFGR